MVVVAQLVRALVCGAGGRGFESHQSPILKKRVDKINSFFILFYLDYEVTVA
jgi:hypothetical protein